MAKQVFDLRPGVGMSAGQSREHLRNYSVLNPDVKKYGYYDPTRVNLNFEVGRGGVIMPVNKAYSISQRFTDNLRNRGIEDPNKKKKKMGLAPNRRTVANIILGGSRAQMHRLAYGDQKVNLTRDADNSHITRHEDIEKWAKDMYDFVSRQFGEENIIAFVVHLDEKNPHVHCTLVPVNEKGKISFNDVCGSNIENARKKYKMFHDAAAEVNKKWGLERGDNINITGAKHRTSEEYWQWLRESCNDLEYKMGGNMESLDYLNNEIRRAEIRVKGLSKMVENLRANKDNILLEIEELQQEAQEGRITQEEMNKTLSLLQSKLTDLEAKLKEKNESLEKAIQRKEMVEQQLSATAQRLEKAEEDYHALQRAINKDLPKLHEKALHDVSATGWDEAEVEARNWLERLGDYVNKLAPSERRVFDKVYQDMFDGSIIEDLAQHGSEIAAVAAALSLGYIEQAMTFADTHGGGGSSPGTGWGRDPNDDDESWRRKCFHMARAMMQPKGRRLKR